MRSWRSKANRVLRRIAQHVPAESKSRKTLARLWDFLLQRTGGSVELEINDQLWILQNEFRRFPQSYEPEVFRLWESLLNRGDCVWDIGSNIGLFAMSAARVVGESGLVCAWEPSPITFGILSRHIVLNRVADRCVIYQEAIADCNTEMSFSVESDHTTSRLQGSNAGKAVTVPVRTLDYWVENAQRLPSVVKIDIEGAEVLAFQAATRFLRDVRPICILALHPQFTDAYGASIDVIEKALSSNRYHVLDMVGNPASVDEYAEYILVPHEKRIHTDSVFAKK